MANRAKKRAAGPKRKSTDWNIGQPLAFPPKSNPIINRLAKEAVEEAVRGPLNLKRQKRKKR
jgi:hypothetical protein